MFGLVRFLARLSGCAAVAAALVTAVVDGSKMIARSDMVFTTFGEFWLMVGGQPFTRIASIDGAAPLDGPAMSSSLDLLALAPLSLVFALAGAMLLWAGWPRASRTLSYV